MLKRTLLAVLVLAAVMPAAHAATPPTNDDFANAQAIGALPFTDAVDFTDATLEGGEQCAWGSQQTVWYRYQPPIDGRLTVSIQYSGIDDGSVGVFNSNGSPRECLRAFSPDETSSIQTFTVYGGRPAYFQIAIIPTQGQAPLATITFDYPAKIDLGVSAITIDNPPVSPSDLPARRHVIHVTITNYGGAASDSGDQFAVQVCPATGGPCDPYLSNEEAGCLPYIPAGGIAVNEAKTYDFAWTSVGVGEFDVMSSLIYFDNQADTNPGNDTLSTRSVDIADVAHLGVWITNPSVLSNNGCG